MSNNLRNQIFLGDNVDILRNNFSDNCIDLIYVDPPPFNNCLNKHKDDLSIHDNGRLKGKWCWNADIKILCNELIYKGPEQLSTLISFFVKFIGANELTAYLMIIAERLIEMQRVLKSTGSIYFHCPPDIDFYIKLIMNAIFGAQQFKNKIIWLYDKKDETLDNIFKESYDILLFYTKSNEYVFNYKSLINLVEEEKLSLANSRYLGRKGCERIFLRNQIEKQNNINDNKPIIDSNCHNFTMRDSWYIPLIDKESNECTGYPGQKPEALLERIINISSNHGDLVLDPFVGSGTTVVVSEFLNRYWVGIDISRKSISILDRRLLNTFGYLGGG